MALKILSVSFGTILKGSAPVFTMLWGLLFRIETFSVKVFLALVTISTGIAVASVGEGADFILAGFLLQLVGTALAGLRWALTQVLLRGQAEPMPPISAILYTSPATAACIFPIAIAVESRKVVKHVAEMESIQLWNLAAALGFIATLVFVLLVSEYWLVHDTSSLALSVAAVFKELMTIAGGIVFFNEHVTMLNIVGFVTCQTGIAAYVWLRYTPKESESSMPAEEDLEEPLANGEFHNHDELWEDHLSPMPNRPRPHR